MEQRTAPCAALPGGVAVAVSLVLAALPSAGHASFLPPELLATAADYIAVFVLLVVPVGVLWLFWLIHILPEKIAEKRHHPQKDAIKTLCLLSLAFGGMLWPFAWLWAYSKPVAYRLAYGTEKHEDYFEEMAHKMGKGELLENEIAHLRHELDAMAAGGSLPPKLRALREELDALPAAEAQEGGR